MTPADPQVWITGMGAVTATASNTLALGEALRQGVSGVDTLPPEWIQGSAAEIGALAEEPAFTDLVEDDETVAVRPRLRKMWGRIPASCRLSAAAAVQAYAQAVLGGKPLNGERIGLVIAGSNLHQQDILTNVRKFDREPLYIQARYGMGFLDTFQVGCLSEAFAIHGPGQTVGGASAGGNAAIWQGYQWVRQGLVSACMVIGAAADLTPLELQGFSLLGALARNHHDSGPTGACRPFDAAHAGFVWGRAAGCLILESATSARNRGVAPQGAILGGAIALDGNRLTNPSVAGEARAMRLALAQAGLTPADIDYINAHGTGAPLGDRTECEAIHAAFAEHAGKPWINSSKPLFGHGLHAAGVLEAIASVLQMNGGFIHPNINLNEPIDDGLRFAGRQAEHATVRTTLSNSFGFGGINTALVLASAEHTLA